MPNIETVEVQAEPETQALTVRPSQAVGLFGSDQPLQIIHKATDVATALKAVIVKQGLVSNIQGKQYPKCEAWTLLGTMLGVFPVLCWSKPVEGGWEARVEARTKDGATVGAAEAQCLKSERNWSNRDDFALRSMAQTRATAKCLRMPLGFVMTLAGYEPTPAEEMVADHPHKPTKDVWVCPNCGQTNSGWSKECGRCEKPKEEAKPKPSESVKLKSPTAATRVWMIDQLTKAGLHDIAVEYFQKLDSPAVLMPKEGLSEVPLWSVPNCHQEMSALITKIKEFGNGDRAGHAFPPHLDADDPHPPKPAAESLPKAPLKDPEWWRDVKVPIPRKGQRIADYIDHEDTLGSLFDLRHGNDEEAQAARQRLWGMVEFRSDADNLKDKDGKKRAPTDVDRQFANALQAFKQWFDDTHRGEKL